MEAFTRTEMAIMPVLVAMETLGVGLDSGVCEAYREVVESRLEWLQQQCYQLAGQEFALTNPKDVSRILFDVLKLQHPTLEGLSTANAGSYGSNNGAGGHGGGKGALSAGRKMLGPSARRSARSRPVLSTNKAVLEQLAETHVLPRWILEWRVLSKMLVGVIFQLKKVERAVPGGFRLFVSSNTFTATGRIALHDPNLQNLPKSFSFLVHKRVAAAYQNLFHAPITSKVENKGGLQEKLVSKEIDDRKRDREEGTARTIGAVAARGMDRNGKRQENFAVCDIQSEDDMVNVCIKLRDTIVADRGKVLLSADYCQLEMRILAHLSQDPALIRVLNSDSDVFDMIAREWLTVSLDKVSPQQRKHSKAMCYGIVYGMGPHKLSRDLHVTIDEATAMIALFRSKFSVLTQYIQQTIAQCRSCGYVCTIAGRRRYLGGITSKDSGKASAAERQAVNTTIQGSAADLVKRAMVNIHALCVYRGKEAGGEESEDRRQTEEVTRVNDADYRHGGAPHDEKEGNGCSLLLQIHDELLFEVDKTRLDQHASMVRREMEMAMPLQVRLPVRLMVGHAWGSLEPFEERDKGFPENEFNLAGLDSEEEM